MGTDTTKLRRQFELRLKKVMIVGIVTGLILGFLLCLIINIVKNHGKEKAYKTQIEELTKTNKELADKAEAAEEAQEAANMGGKLLASDDDGWSLALVNEAHPLDISYEPELAEIAEGRYVDARIAGDTSQMLQDAAAEGLSMYVVSAYRSYASQREVFNSTMVDWIAQGYGPLDAYDETKKSVAVPGSSEHATGLALDITSMQYDALDDQQANTAEAKWLAGNCWKYGFILRYPPEKSDVTGIIFEPWHYRYVGKEAAKEITEANLTLEEYLAK